MYLSGLKRRLNEFGVQATGPDKPGICNPRRHSSSAARRTGRTLILSVSAGAGHTRAAEAIRAAASARGDDQAVIHCDVLDFVPAGYRLLYRDLYIALVARHPVVWGQLYHASNRTKADSLLQALRRAIERMCTRRMRDYIRRLAPDSIICTHFLPAEILAHGDMSDLPPFRTWVQVTDFDLHRMWIQPNMTGYFVATEELAYRLCATGGIRSERVQVTGIPVMPGFATALCREQCAREAGLHPDRPTILLAGGGAGMGGLPAVAERLMSMPENIQLIVLAGRNADTLRQLQTLARRHGGRLKPCGFTLHVERLMACADIVMTKPGGLTSAECLALGKPMLLLDPIPGQEERNADYLLEQGAAIKAGDPVMLEYRLRQLLRDELLLAEMGARARALGRPDAAARVLHLVESHALGSLA